MLGTGKRGLSKPLCKILQAPRTGGISVDAPLKLPVFTRTVRRLGSLSVTCDEGTKRVFSSRGVILTSSELLVPDNAPMSTVSPRNVRDEQGRVELPRFIGGIFKRIRGRFCRRVGPRLGASAHVDNVGTLLDRLKCGVKFSGKCFIFGRSDNVRATAKMRTRRREAIRFVGSIQSGLRSYLSRMVCTLGICTSLCKLTSIKTCRIGCSFKSVLCIHRGSHTE